MFRPIIFFIYEKHPVFVVNIGKVRFIRQRTVARTWPIYLTLLIGRIY